jgi:hypothetical protein
VASTGLLGSSNVLAGPVLILALRKTEWKEKLEARSYFRRLVVCLNVMFDVLVELLSRARLLLSLTMKVERVFF